MTATLQDAVAAARAGDTQQAQLLTFQVLQNDPNNANGWYLMSQLVESEARRTAYLRKTLELDPNHPRAAAEFEALGLEPVAEAAPVLEAAEPPVSIASDEDYAAYSALFETPAARDVEAVPPAAGAQAPPERLQPLSPEPVAPAATAGPAHGETGVEPVAVTSPPAVRSRKPAKRRRKKTNQALSLLLGILIFLTLVVLGVLVYLLFF